MGGSLSRYPAKALWIRVLLAVTGAIAVAICGRVDVAVPGSPVPQSLQTLAVLLVGAGLGPRTGALSIGAYLFAGALGAPVFADGAAGWVHLLGPTSGYLIGFVVAAVLVGYMADRKHRRGFGHLVATMIVAHAIILGLGWVRLAIDMGPGVAFSGGVKPFLLGGLAKSLVAAAALLGSARLTRSFAAQS